MMHVLGIDFTSSPKKKKSLKCIRATLLDGSLTYKSIETWNDFLSFEQALAKPGPWICGIDAPFGQSRRFIENIEWPKNWHGYVQYAHKLGRDGFRQAMENYKRPRPMGDKEHKRRVDKICGGVSPQKLYGVPVGLMFFECVPRLLNSGATIISVRQPGDPERLIVESYPGILVKKLMGTKPAYKSESTNKQTRDQLEARYKIFAQLQSDRMKQECGFTVQAPRALCEDPTGDELDSLLCAVQAAWAWTKREENHGMPTDVAPLEGWIPTPFMGATYTDSLDQAKD